jgi:catechol 2,3-dioxygenase-like lactoylglutathione lyase family enzyme
MRVDSLDHLVLTVASIEATATFYGRVLGMERREFAPGRVALHFGGQKLNLHETTRVVDSNVRHATPGSADLCFLTSAPLEEVLAHLTACGVKVIEGPVRRTGARGPIESVYFHDPDENLIEVGRMI